MVSPASLRKNIDDFRREHDPSHKHEYTGVTYSRPIKWKDAHRVIVVAAQNATPIEKDFWAILNHMAEVLNAELLVIPMRYKNPTSLWTGSQQGSEWYAPELRPYLWNQRTHVNQHVTVLGDIKAQPTNSSPLTGLDALAHGGDAVVGHVRAQSRSIATMGSPAGWLTTTGATTVPNYTESRIGMLGDFHHSLSAVLIEDRHIRRLNYSKKSKRVIDLGVAYYADRHEVAPPSIALVMGDTHVDYVDRAVDDATFFVPGSIVERTRPKHLIWHDLLDGHSCNPHHLGNPFADIAKYFAGRSSVNDETLRAVEHVRARTAQSAKLASHVVKSVLVPSNHIDFLLRWIMKSDWKQLPAENRAFYLKTALHMAENTKLTESGMSYPDPFTEIFRAAKVENAVALDSGESFRLAGVELGMHGDKGPNGARGSLQNIKNTAAKSITGHSHQPGETEGAVAVGTSTKLKLEYNSGGASSWLHAHAQLTADGTRQLILIRNGKFTG